MGLDLALFECRLPCWRPRSYLKARLLTRSHAYRHVQVDSQCLCPQAPLRPRHSAFNPLQGPRSDFSESRSSTARGRVRVSQVRPSHYGVISPPTNRKRAQRTESNPRAPFHPDLVPPNGCIVRSGVAEAARKRASVIWPGGLPFAAYSVRCCPRGRRAAGARRSREQTTPATVRVVCIFI